MGLSEHQKVIMRYELDKHKDFFYILWEVCNGVIKRQHIMRLYPTTSKTRIKNWLEAGLIKEKPYAGAMLYELRYTTNLGLVRQPDLSADKMLRSIMRMEYFFSIGLETPAAIRSYAEKGTNRVNRRDLTNNVLSAYDRALRERNIHLYKLDSKDNADSLYNLSLHNAFVDKIKVKGSTIIPCIVLLSFREHYPYEVVREVMTAYHAIKDIFFDYKNETDIQPRITICRFGEEGKADVIYKLLVQAPEFALWEMEDIKAHFKVVEVDKPFRYLDPSKVV